MKKLPLVLPMSSRITSPLPTDLAALGLGGVPVPVGSAAAYLLLLLR